MSLRTLIRIVALALSLTTASVAGWQTVGATPLLAGLSLLGLTLGYLLLRRTGESSVTRWRMHHRLQPEQDLVHVQGLLRFLAAKTGHIVLEVSSQGFILEVPSAMDQYVGAQLPRALPGLQLSKENGAVSKTAGSSFFALGWSPHSSFQWAKAQDGRLLRMHVHEGPYATIIAQTEQERPPGYWLRLPVPGVLSRVWRRIPIWDELSTRIPVGALLECLRSSETSETSSRLLSLLPPVDHQSDATGRRLGHSPDGQLVALQRRQPLFTVSAPHRFLFEQALADLEFGRTVVIISPHRRILEKLEQHAGEAAVYWLDQQHSTRSAHLCIVPTEEWENTDNSTVISNTAFFLANLGLDMELPAVNRFAHSLVGALANSARNTGQQLSFLDLLAASLSPQSLKAFLVRSQDLTGPSGMQLLELLDDERNFVQAVAILSTIRSALSPLSKGPLHALSIPPFLNLQSAMENQDLVLVPMTNTDFPHHDRLLSAMLDLVLSQVLVSGDPVQMALHLHDPHVYRTDLGQRWMDVAKHDTRLSLLLDVQDPERHTQPRRSEVAEIAFRCSEGLASRLIETWHLPLTSTDLTEMPPGMALVRLPGGTVAMKVESS